MAQGVVAFELNCCFLSGAEEQAKRETAEKEKQLLEEKYTQLQQRVEALETIFQESMAQMRKERERETENLRKQNEKFQRLEVSLVRVWTVTAERSSGTLGREA